MAETVSQLSGLPDLIRVLVTADTPSGILAAMWWMVGLIILTVLSLSSALVAFVFHRSTAEDRTLLGDRSKSTVERP
ncbi:hypothetical protein CJ178_14435 [Rhodococcus sp. ACPA4]|nr:hypothetical protein [Rhodococcus sp. MS16]PBC42623.1 hypothetical protein CJ178_14435 [Rhodococcus sp. ACPA4]PSR42147.1 hypothetical protein C7T36_08030 [Rhodococcus sp. AD45-ID]RZL26218.1 MAG: hypothetical protein EOP31_06590 [Rhodococcus sp. (in: high G+C Gram-positive bacteria)]